jgi:hypothetical protein
MEKERHRGSGEKGERRALSEWRRKKKKKKVESDLFSSTSAPAVVVVDPPLSPSPSPSPPSRRNLWRSASEPSKRSWLAENPDASSLRRSRLPSRGEERGRENVDEKKKGKVEVEVDNTNKIS